MNIHFKVAIQQSKLLPYLYTHKAKKEQQKAILKELLGLKK